MKAKFDKIFHDINSGLSSTEQGIALACEHLTSDPLLTEKVLLLSLDKIRVVLQNWQELKEIIREK